MVVKQTATSAAASAGSAGPSEATGSSTSAKPTSGPSSSSTASTPKARIEALAKTMEFKWFAAHAVVVISTVLMLLTWFLPRASKFFYRIAFVAAFTSFAIILYQKYGKTKPSLNVLIRDDNFQYAVFTLGWTFTARRVLALFPLAIFSLFHFLTYSRSYLLPALGHPANSSLVQRIDSIVKNCNEPLTVLAANFELALAVQLLLGALTFAKGSWLQLVFYIAFFRLRYATSAYTRHAVKAWEVRVDQLLGHPSLPPQVKHYWAQAKAYLARIPGPVTKP